MPPPPKPSAPKVSTKRKAAVTTPRKTTANKLTKSTVKAATQRFLQSTTPRWRDIFQAAANNDTFAVKYFVEQNANLVRMADDDDKTVALIAAENGNFELLQFVVEKDQTMLIYPDVFGNTVLQRVIEKSSMDMVKYLVDKHNWDVSKPNKRSFGNTPIHVAAEQGQLDILKYFIEEKSGDPNIRNDMGDPPAFLAADKSQLEIIKYLVEKCKADMSALNNHKCNILYSSAKTGDVAIPKYLLDEKKISFDINWRDIMNSTVLYTATRYIKYEFVEYIVNEHHADVNIPDELGRTPLHVAAYQNNYPMCKYLVDHGADLEVKDVYNKMPIQDASDRVVIGFLDDMTNMQRRERAERGHRTRRNVPQELLGPQIAERWPQSAIAGNLHGSEMAVSYHENEIGYGLLDNFLLIADTAFKYTKGRVSRNRTSYQAYSLAAESIKSRIDSLALVDDLSFLK